MPVYRSRSHHVGAAITKWLGRIQRKLQSPLRGEPEEALPTRVGRYSLGRELEASDASGLCDYDFFDFGCGSGSTLQKVFRVRPELKGLGFDTSAEKVQLARERRFEAVVYDIRRLPEEKLVSFVTLCHFLEHLESVVQARVMLAKAISVARDFALVRQPWFDADGELFQLGLKYYWSDWRGHKNRMVSLDFVTILRDELAAQRIRGFFIAGRRRVTSSRHKAILPLSAPIDQHDHSVDAHGAKPRVRFKFRAFEEIVVVVDISGSAQAHAAVAQLEPFEILYSS